MKEPSPERNGRSIVRFELELPDERWAGWTPGSADEDVADELASSLGVGAAAQANVRRSVESIDNDSRKKGDYIVQNAVWVPEPLTGEIAAVLDATVRITPGGDTAPERYLARNRRADFGWATRIVEYAASQSDVPAGRMTVERTLLRPFGGRRVQSYLFLRVFPPGADEAFSLILNTVHLDLVPDLDRQGRMVAESLRLTLGDIPGGRRRS